VFKHFLRVAASIATVMCLLMTDAYGQTAGDTRVRADTGEPEKFDGRRWGTDYSKLNPGALYGTDVFSGTIANASPHIFPVFVPDVTGTYEFNYSAQSVTGNAWFRIGTTGGAFDIFEGANPIDRRLYPTELNKTVEIELIANVEYYIQSGAGGGSTSTDAAYFIRYSGIDREFSPEISGLESLGITFFTATT